MISRPQRSGGISFILSAWVSRNLRTSVSVFQKISISNSAAKRNMRKILNGSASIRSTLSPVRRITLLRMSKRPPNGSTTPPSERIAIASMLKSRCARSSSIVFPRSPNARNDTPRSSPRNAGNGPRASTVPVPSAIATLYMSSESIASVITSGFMPICIIRTVSPTSQAFAPVSSTFARTSR